MNTNVLKLQVFHGNEMREWKVFDDPRVDVIKIGSLTSSQVMVEGISRMQAVIERNAGGFRLIDLGGTPATHVSGEKVRNADLRNGDTIHFGPTGPWSMRVTIEPASELEVEPRRDAHKATRDSGDSFDGLLADLGMGGKSTEPYHHQHTFDSLLAMIEKVGSANKDDNNDIKRLTSQFRKSFGMYDDAGKAAKLRTLVDLLRSIRKDSRYQEAIGIGIAEAAIKSMRDGATLFELSEDEAVERALNLMLQLKDAKEGIKFLHSLPDSWQKEDGAEYISRGLARVEQELARRTSVVLMDMLQCLYRAGGQSKENWLAQTQANQGKLLVELEKLPKAEWDKLPPTILEFLSEVRERQAQ